MELGLEEEGHAIASDMSSEYGQSMAHGDDQISDMYSLAEIHVLKLANG